MYWDFGPWPRGKTWRRRTHNNKSWPTTWSMCVVYTERVCDTFWQTSHSIDLYILLFMNHTIMTSYLLLSVCHILSYGLLFGIGLSMVRETSSLMLSQYFKRRRELVEMLSSTGTGVGVAIFTNVFYAGIG